MKSHYEKAQGYGDEPGQYRYSLSCGGYHRAIHTFPELRDRDAVIYDDELRDLKVFPRASRSHGVLDAWNDFNIKSNYGRSWKRYTKHRKQWMVGDDPKSISRNENNRLLWSAYMIYLNMGGDLDKYRW